MAKQDKDKTENEFVDVSNIEEMQKEFMSTQEVKPKKKRVKKTQQKEIETKQEIKQHPKNKKYNHEERVTILNDIFLQIKLDNKSVRSVFRNDNPNKPEINQNTFYEWLRDNKDFGEQYARACEERADFIFDEILEITDETKFDMVAVQQARIQVDARKWILSKMNPKKYGDKIEVDSTIKGEITNNVIDYSKLSTNTLTDLINNSQKND